MRVDQQVQWIVKWYWEQRELGRSLDARNFEMETAFIEATGIELKHSLWNSRVREAARFIGLSGCRHYNAESSASAGIPLYTMVYS